MLFRSESILHDQLALLFGNFEMIDLKPFDFDESKAFLKERFPNRILESELVRFLIRLTNGCPYYLDLLARRFRQFSGNDNVISNQKLIVQALTEELYEPSGLLNLRFFGRLYQLADGKAWSCNRCQNVGVIRPCFPIGKLIQPAEKTQVEKP